MSIVINEELARRNKENMSFSDYKPGSATQEYKEMCQEADERAAKFADNPKAQAAVERYKIEIGNWLNKSYSRGSRHVSSFISGPSNYNMRAHEKWLAAEDKGRKEYNEINNRFNAAMRGAAKPVIHTSDSNALEALQEKLAKALEEHAAYIEHNKTARKEKRTADILPAYVTSNSNGRIKSIRDRIAQVEKLQTRERKKAEFEGGYIEENIEVGRTQIFFDSKPDEETRAKLKSNGWRWAPSAGAWQRQLTANAWYNATKQLFKEA